MTHTMRKYTVLAVLGINPGTILGLSHKQAGPRAHALRPIEVDDKAKMGHYEVTSRVEFKVGEVIYTDSELNKALATALEPEEATRQKAADKRRADADEKELASLRGKAKQWDEVQPALEDLQTKAALWDALPEAVRAEAVQKAEAELKAAEQSKK